MGRALGRIHRLVATFACAATAACGVGSIDDGVEGEDDTFAVRAQAADPTAPGVAVCQDSGSFGIQGEVKTLLILSRFQDNPTAYDFYLTPDYVRTSLATVDAFIREASYGAAWLNAQVAGPYVLPVDTAAANYTSILNLSQAAALAEGIDPAAFRYVIFAFPDGAQIVAAGYSAGRNIFLSGVAYPDLVAHEMGHSFGMSQHSHVADEWCGRTFHAFHPIDVMGNGMASGNSPRHFNAFQKRAVGWLNCNAGSRIAVAQTSGTYSLEPYETAGNGGLKALKVPLYYRRTLMGHLLLEYRQPLGFDRPVYSDDRLWTSNVFGGVLLTSDTNYLYDMTPSSDCALVQSGWDEFMKDPALTPGRTFCSAYFKVAIKVIEATESGATVQVTQDARCRTTSVY